METIGVLVCLTPDEVKEALERFITFKTSEDYENFRADIVEIQRVNEHIGAFVVIKS